MIAYKLPHDSYNLSQIFGILHSLKNHLEDFSISQASVEEVFLKLAKEQEVKGKHQSDETIVS